MALVKIKGFSMKKCIAFVLLAAVSLMAAQVMPSNYTGWSDTCSFQSFKKDSLAYGPAFPSSAAENKVLMFMANDSTNAGFSGDSVKVAVGYQRGYIVMNSSGKIDTSWRGIVIADTFDCLTAANFLIPTAFTTQDSSTFYENMATGKIDTSYVTGFAVLSVPIIPIWSPIIRPVVKGLTGNKVGQYLKFWFLLQQRAYSTVRGN